MRNEFFTNTLNQSKLDNEITITLSHAKKTTLNGFASFWGVHVRGFNAKKHCQYCLLGKRESSINIGIPAAVPISILMRGDYFYLCGVVSTRGISHKEYMRRNFHMPVRCSPSSTATKTTYNGFTVTVENAELIPFTGEVAKELYGDLPEKYWTCRNFQFGAQMYREK
ncbi:MAG: hypothetical protein FWE95_10935 [Planctomycetaceae bacterium]|nr:hypothetical protein [Planctomycetaceae bacterium]